MGTNLFDKISKLRMIHRVIIFLGTVIIIVGLYAWRVYIPKTAEIETIKSELGRLESSINIARVRAKNLKGLEAELSSARIELEVALKLLPTTSEIPSLLKNITKFGNESNLEFLLFSPERPVSKEFFVEIPVSIEVLGNYHDVATFFDKVGKLDRIVNVVDVNMTPTKALSTILKTTCKATTYRFKEGGKTQSAHNKKK